MVESGAGYGSFSHAEALNFPTVRRLIHNRDGLGGCMRASDKRIQQMQDPVASGLLSVSNVTFILNAVAELRPQPTRADIEPVIQRFLATRGCNEAQANEVIVEPVIEAKKTQFVNAASIASLSPNKTEEIEARIKQLNIAIIDEMTKVWGQRARQAARYKRTMYNPNVYQRRTVPSNDNIIGHSKQQYPWIKNEHSSILSTTPTPPVVPRPVEVATLDLHKNDAGQPSRLRIHLDPAFHTNHASSKDSVR